MTTPVVATPGNVPDVEAAFAAVVPSSRNSPRLSCRVCGSTTMLSYLNLGKQPYANALQPFDAPLTPVAPLRLFACQRCQLSQISHVVPRTVLYGNYAYRSGVSAGWRKHCAALAREYGGADKFTIDIASNDGTMVGAMRASGAEAYGVEPSHSFDDCGYDRICEWWSRELVEKLEIRVDVITAQNVLGHVADVHDFIRGVALALKPDGVAIIEVPYVDDLLRTLAFDTIYHEHLSYWSVTALRELCNANNITLSDVQPLTTHGGSIRAILRHGTDVNPRVAQYLAREVRDLRKSAYLRFSERVSTRMADLNDTLRSMVPYVGFGAAAKTTVMLGCVDVRAYPVVVYDDNIHKHGFAIPGTRVPILLASPNEFRDMTKPICIFAWNHADTIIPRLRAEGYRGDIFVPTSPMYWDTL